MDRCSMASVALRDTPAPQCTSTAAREHVYYRVWALNF